MTRRMQDLQIFLNLRFKCPICGELLETDLDAAVHCQKEAKMFWQCPRCKKVEEAIFDCGCLDRRK
jgi:uncharacterized C2H2 Zn-finger protein